MRAVLLAAGLGKRLRPLTDNLPKCLAPIHGRPLLGYWLDLLVAGGVTEILINTHYLPEQIRDFVLAGGWSKYVTLVHEDTLLGTGGTLLRNRDFLGAGPFIVAHADNLTCFDVADFIHCHLNRPAGVEIAMMTFTTPTPHSCGIVEIDGEGVVCAFHEKVALPPSKTANAAVYVFEPSVLDFLSDLGKTVIDISTEVLPHYIGRIQVFHNSRYHRDIGTLQSWQEAQSDYIGCSS